MNQPFPSDPDWIAFLLGIIFTSLGFTFYHFLNTLLIKPLRWGKGSPDNNVRNILLQRLSGVFIYGMLPLFLFIFLIDERTVGYYTGKLSIETFYWLIPIAVLVIIINYLNAGKEDNLNMYPEIRKSRWTVSLVFLSALSWIAYLLAYEFIFRGLLFIPAYKLFGFWPAVLINIGIYSLVHVPKGAKEGIGSIVLGFILCLLVVKTGSFWIAFFIHIVLALSNEWFSIMKNPEIKLARI
jgi:membrane protease YdiL (CAAX protease family)